jgi:hypothetical protein
VVKLGGIAVIAIASVSCHNEVPELLEEYKYCKYEDKNGDSKCKSTYEISEDDCEFVGGELFNDVASCEESL